MMHDIKGTRMVTTKKTWGKLKNGMHGWKYAKVTTYTCGIGIASNIENGETGNTSKKVENCIPDSEITQNKNEQTDSMRSAGSNKTILEHSGISGVASRGADADESDSFDRISGDQEIE